MKLTRSVIRKIICEQLTLKTRDKGSWQGWVSESEDEEGWQCVDIDEEIDSVVSEIIELVETQTASLNPVSGAERIEDVSVPAPILQGRIVGADTADQAAQEFANDKDIMLGDYHISCEKSAGKSWSCVANRLDSSLEAGISFPQEEPPQGSGY
tara:strand:+ start:13035 stop:13496 length:462 start_codon:yes stop_codon:yes gene_type:complete